jgi:hypothetical protein
MGNTFFAVFILLHGFAHIWYIVLAQQWVAFKPEMGFTGQSWVFTQTLGESATRKSAAVFYGTSTLAFILAAITIFTQASWIKPALIFASMLSIITILIFWDGKFERIVEKGLIGFIINVLVFILVVSTNFIN